MACPLPPESNRRICQAAFALAPPHQVSTYREHTEVKRSDVSNLGTTCAPDPSWHRTSSVRRALRPDTPGPPPHRTRYAYPMLPDTRPSASASFQGYLPSGVMGGPGPAFVLASMYISAWKIGDIRSFVRARPSSRLLSECREPSEAITLDHNLVEHFRFLLHVAVRIVEGPPKQHGAHRVVLAVAILGPHLLYAPISV